MENLKELINEQLQEYTIIFSDPWTNNEYSCFTMEDISKELFKQIMLFGETNVEIRRK